MPSPRTSPRQASPARLDWFDSWRGLALLAILLFHFTFDQRHLQAPHVQLLKDALAHPQLWLTWLAATGYQGVHLFIVCSGAALMYTARKESQGAFWRRHTSRVVVPYWWALVLTVIALLGLAALRDIGHHTGLVWEFWHNTRESGQVIPMGWKELWASATLIPRLVSPWYYGVAPASGWFVVLLVQLYAFFPLLRRWLNRWGSMNFLLAVALISIATRALFVVIASAPATSNWLNIIAASRFFEFGFGMVLGLHLTKLQRPTVWRWAPLAVGLWVIGTLLDHGWTLVMSSQLIAVGATIASLPLAWYSRKVSWLQWLGRFSLPIFLSHDLVRFVFSSWPLANTVVTSWPWGFVIFVPVVALVGWLFSHFLSWVSLSGSRRLSP